MVQLKQIPRNATFAWSPASGMPMIASGRVAGAVDASFSSESELELWDLGLDDDSTEGFELRPKSKVSTTAKFYDLAWGYTGIEKPRGIIAGAMDTGELNLWDAQEIINCAPDDSTLLVKNKTHQGAIKSLDFNPVNPKLLLSAGVKGEFWIWDMENPNKPFSSGSRPARQDDIEAAAWNRQVSNIMAVGSTNGFTSVWDLKAGREILHLQTPGRKSVSSIAWHPENATKVITASSDDSCPDLFVWDLRNSNAPEKLLKGHDAGILSLSWCQADPDLLLSSGKDNRTIFWNPQASTLLGELALSSNWVFETQWCPKNPGFYANASFEGKITVHTLQNTKATKDNNVTSLPDGREFFERGTFTDPTAAGGFSLQQAPRWLRKPTGVSFGFGGQIVSFGIDQHLPPPLAGGQPANLPKQTIKQTIKITKYVSEPSISEQASAFEEAVQSKDWIGFCRSQLNKTLSDAEKANWKLLETLFANDPRKQLVEYLGFHRDDLDSLLAEKLKSVAIEDSNTSETAEQKKSIVTNGIKDSTDLPKDSKSLSTVFGPSGKEHDSFLFQLNSAPGPGRRSAYTKTDPFFISSTSESESDKLITQAILLGRFDKAVDVCLNEDRLLDAFVLATCGDKNVQRKVQEAYFASNNTSARYLRLLSSIVDSNLWDVAENADLAGWKESLVVFCNFAKGDEEFARLCETLGERLEREGRTEEAKVSYLAGKKLDSVVKIWIAEADAQENLELKEAILNADGTTKSAFTIHARALQSFVEKVTVLQQSGTGNNDTLKADGDLTLYDKYTEFVEIIASQGNFEVARKISLIIPGDNLKIRNVRDRLNASFVSKEIPGILQNDTVGQRVNPMKPPMPQTQSTRSTLPPIESSGRYIPNTIPTVTGIQGLGQTSGLSQYVPADHQPSATRYASTGPMATAPGIPPPPPRAASMSNQNLPPPPAPSSRAAKVESWNDPPMVTNSSRRNTPLPSIPPPPSFSSQSPPQMQSPSFPAQRQTTPLGPPPANAKPPQRVTSPPVTQTSQLAPSSMLPAYPPPPGQTFQSRDPRDFSRPPQGVLPPAVPSIGPVLQGQQYQQPSIASNSSAPYQPPMQPQQAPNRYAPPPAASQYAPQQRQQFHQNPLPAPGVPTSSGRPDEVSSVSSPVQTKPPASTSKYPSGDRSHIPLSNMPIFEALTGELNRLKERATKQQERVVADTERRLNILFDLLNNDEGIPPKVVSALLDLSQALVQKDFQSAYGIQMELLTGHEQFAVWLTGVRRLLDMARQIP